MTLREQAWHITLVAKLTNCEPFKRRELNFEESERHTVQRALNSMEDAGYLYRESKTSGVWYPDVLTKALFGQGELSKDEMQRLSEQLEPVSEQTGIPVAELREQLR